MSATRGSQTLQLPPPTPQVALVGCSQTPNLQHPVTQLAGEHDAALHMPPSQLPLPHCTQVPPPTPQLCALVPLRQTPLSQHPVAQLVASQVATAQPPSWQLSEVQDEQVAPPAPQALGEVPSWHAPCASQHPLGQLAALQVVTQAFCRQAPPVPQPWHIAPPVPQALSWFPPRQTPPWQQPLVQLLGPHSSAHCCAALQVVEHIEQAMPPVPQACGSVPATHMPSRQQPLGHVWALQVPTQAPASQEPAAHERQAIAPMPQAVFSLPLVQLEPAQHPAQFDALQAAIAQVLVMEEQALPPQSRQARPPVPQAAEELPGKHRPPMQQPEGHEAAVHWHRRFRHSTPGSHAGPLPQRHSPLTQVSAPMASVHAGPVPHPQRPSAPQVSVVISGHDLQAGPHNETFSMRQTPLEQQPRQPSQPDIGALSTTVTGFSELLATTTNAEPWLTLAPAISPPTRTSTVRLSRESGSSTRTVVVLASG